MDLLHDMMAVFAKFEAVCAAHNLRFWIDWGTMLGALRHGGIIPWDYDIDVCMFRADYDKLMGLFKASGYEKDGMYMSPDYYSDPGCCFVMGANRDESVGIDVVAYDMSPDGKRIVTCMSEATQRDYPTEGLPDVYNLVADEALPMRRVLLGGSLVYCPKNAEERCAMIYGNWTAFPTEVDVSAWQPHVLKPPATWASPAAAAAALDEEDDSLGVWSTCILTVAGGDDAAMLRAYALRHPVHAAKFEDVVCHDGAALWGKVSSPPCLLHEKRERAHDGTFVTHSCSSGTPGYGSRGSVFGAGSCVVSWRRRNADQRTGVHTPTHAADW